MANLSNILERLSTRAKNALVASQKLAESARHKYIEPEHLLYGIISEANSFAAEVILKNKLPAETVREEILLRHRDAAHAEHPTVSAELQDVLEKSAIVAQRYGYQFIGTEHFLYALTNGETMVVELLVKFGQRPEEIKKNLKHIFENFSRVPNLSPGEEESFGTEEPQENPSRVKTPTLDYFTTDLTARAGNGLIDPLVGRQKEIGRLVSILNRRTKNNPVLIGEPGVGKTAIVEGLAHAIVKGEVPDFLLDKKILYLDLALVIAGSMFRGEFENRLKQIIDEVKDNQSIILFIDELHTVVGAGATTGSLDAANILKPALARGEITVIGATTIGDYKKHVETDPALERRFQPIMVEEPSVAQTKEILRGLRPFYEKHHRIRITDEAVERACELSARYITDRFLPDKALDLIDESAATLRTQLGTSSEIRELRAADSEIKKLEERKVQAVLNQDFRGALKIKVQQEKLSAGQAATQRKLADNTAPLPELTGEHIARTVANITKIPLEKLAKKETQRLVRLEKILTGRIVGQDEILATIARTIRRARTGIAAAGRPQGSFLFLGPTGVGKTETAKVLAEEIFGSSSDLIRIDMSELMERHNVARLIGAPAGYVGFEEGGKLTEAVRRKPHAVVLLDEIEKAHPDVFNILLQILEEGELTDAAGKKVNFKNTIVILTSNIGSGDFNRYALGFAERARNADKPIPDYQQLQERALAALRERMSPELLNRIDTIAVFRPLDGMALKKIIRLELEKLKSRLRQQEILVDFDARLIDYLASLSFDPMQGARKIRRNIQEHLETAISEQLLLEKISKGSTLSYTANPGAKKPIRLKVG